MRRRFVAVVLAALSLMLTANLVAAEDGGAETITTVVQTRGCVDVEDRFDPGRILTICHHDISVTHETLTPNGNISVSGNSDTRTTVTEADGTFVTDQSTNAHFHFLLTDRTQELHGLNRTTLEFADFTCSFTFMLHLVDDRLQFSRESVECDPPLNELNTTTE